MFSHIAKLCDIKSSIRMKISSVLKMFTLCALLYSYNKKKKKYLNFLLELIS